MVLTTNQTNLYPKQFRCPCPKLKRDLLMRLVSKHFMPVPTYVRSLHFITMEQVILQYIHIRFLLFSLGNSSCIFQITFQKKNVTSKHKYQEINNHSVLFCQQPKLILNVKNTIIIEVWSLPFYNGRLFIRFLFQKRVCVCSLRATRVK